MDGANRLKQTWYVTLPAMQPIIVLTMVLSLQNVLNAGFDQIFNLSNTSVYRSADIIDTWVYRISFESSTPMYSLGAAVGLFKSVVSLFFISSSYYLAYRFANYQIF
jgi:putative aldouronate transport system permease protein